MKRTTEQEETVRSFRRIDDTVYTLVYRNGYGLERVLQKGVRSIGGLLGFVLREMGRQKRSFACSSFNGRTPNGQFVMGRNFDYMDAPLLVVWTSPEKGYKSVAVANATFMLFGKKNIRKADKKGAGRLLLAPYVCMDGINEKGLAIAVLEIKTKPTNQKRVRTPQTTTTVIRAVLDTCATVEEAVSVFENCAMHDSVFCNYHFQITDASGKSVIVEYVRNEIRITYSSGTQSLTNYFIQADGDNSKGFGYERRQYILDTLAEKKTVTEGEAMRILENCHLDYIHKRGYPIITLWSSVYNNTERTMTLCAGLHYDTVYRFAVDKPGVAESHAKTETDMPSFDFPHIDKEMVSI